METDELPQLLIGDAALVRQEGPARRHHSPTRALRRDDVELERICSKKKSFREAVIKKKEIKM